jgi:hypothetical protein
MLCTSIHAAQTTDWPEKADRLYGDTISRLTSRPHSRARYEESFYSPLMSAPRCWVLDMLVATTRWSGRTGDSGWVCLVPTD